MVAKVFIIVCDLRLCRCLVPPFVTSPVSTFKRYTSFELLSLSLLHMLRGRDLHLGVKCDPLASMSGGRALEKTVSIC